MDHKVSKDMISSGMIPSGEKTQADLGKIQYGSAPSPSSLMDAYRSIYEHHQKDKDGNTIPHEDEINEMAGGLAKNAAQRGMAAKAAKNRQLSLPVGKTPAAKPTPTGGTKTTTNRKPQGNPSSVMGRVSQGLSSASKAAGRADKAIAARGGLKKMGTDYLKKNKGNIKGALLGKTAAGTATRIAGAAVVGRMTAGDDKPSGGYDGYRDFQKFDYVPDGDNLSEDLFDLVKSALIEEGYDEKSALKLMSSFTPELLEEVIEQAQEEAQKKNLNEFVFTGTAIAAALAKALTAAKATKMGLAAAKGIAAAKKGLTAMKGIKAATAGTKAATAGTKAATTGAKVTSTGGKVVQGSASKGNFLQKGFSAMKKKPLETAMVGSMVMPQGGGNPNLPAAQRTVGTGRRTAGMQNMDLDLFDIVKGHLLDEGLTEEECSDVMTTLTLEEINETLQLDEISGKLAMKASRAADMKRAQLARAGNKAGAAAKAAQATRLYQGGAKRNLAKQDPTKPSNPQTKVPDNVRAAQRRQTTAGGPKDTGANKYTTQDQKTIIDYHSKNKGSM